MLPDLIVSWPRNCDYPLWRKFITNNRWLFNNVVIVFTENACGDDYRAFIRMALANVPGLTMLQSPEITNGEDWRHVAVTMALNYINSNNPSDWVFFTEQDFIITNDRFWDEVLTAENEGAEVIGALEGAHRLHPCCIFIKRRVLNKTRQFFGVSKDYDHFGQLQIDLFKINPQTHIIHHNYKHMAGLSQNMRLAYDGQKPNFMLGELCKYFENCLNSGVVMPAGFVRMATGVLRKYAGYNDNG